ncbi:MAG: cyclic pyranopterin monophosphate synthase MoaC [Bacteroidetes bacterium]|nr:cyclic pyranopterin monophosphate synthase MoaC [Bacteroidota bacterium]
MPFSHFNKDGLPQMINIKDKADTFRVAIATGTISMQKNTIELIKTQNIKKGDVLTVSQIAGIMAAKKTSNLIPMTHNIPLTATNIEFNILDNKIEITATVSTIGKTGVEIEALTSVSIAAITIYDMCKSADKTMEISDIKLIKKTGGKSCLKS